MLWAFTVRLVKVKYKQAAIGVGWVVVQPLLSAAIFALLWGATRACRATASPYLVFALAGMTGWTYFASAMSTGAQSVVDDQTLLRKVYFPREVLPLGAVGAALVDFGPGLATLVVVVCCTGSRLAASWVTAAGAGSDPRHLAAARGELRARR